MNKFGWLLAGSLVVFLGSCSSPQGIVLASQEETLRNEVQIKAGQTSWSNEIEPERLSSSLNNGLNTTSQEYITPQMISTIKDFQPALYPQIKDFANLDCTAMNKNLLSTVNDFCTQLCKGTDNLQSYFHSKYFFNYVFFKNDFEPIVAELKTKDVLFERYVICKSFESQDLAQVPVRLYNKKDYVDLSVYLTYHNGYKITQIEVIRWGKTYGESEK